MTKPKVLLLDEPSMGLAPMLIAQIFDIIREINKRGTTVLLVEQNANKALSIADYGYVLETGTIALAGDSQQLLRDDRVRRSYLGHR
jgi:branched-chain amino acid transport system ATP-binding protein